MPDAAKKELTEVIRSGSHEQFFYASQHIIRAINAEDEHYKKAQIKKAEDHCHMSMVVAYMAALKALIATHEQYYKLYKDVMVDPETKVMTIGNVRLLRDEIVSYLAREKPKTLDRDRYDLLTKAYTDALEIAKYYSINDSSLKDRLDKKNRETEECRIARRRKILKLVFYTSPVGVISIIFAVFSVLPNDTKLLIMQPFCGLLPINVSYYCSPVPNSSEKKTTTPMANQPNASYGSPNETEYKAR